MTSRALRSLVLVAAVLALLVAGRGLLAAFAAVGRSLFLALFVSLLLAVGYLLYRAVSSGERAYEPGKYGVGRRVLTTDVRLADEPCSACGRSDSDGVRRRFVKELVMDGVPVALVSDGENVYCGECATGEYERETVGESIRER